MMWTGGLWWLAERLSGQSADCSSSIAVVSYVADYSTHNNYIDDCNTQIVS